MIGKTLGHYQISSQLGKGGMGEVYQAKDLTLGRDVAIKVLPEEFAKDADRVARFQREAKLLASLNHPNIAAIYGLEESGGTSFLVLELVEGETLAEYIAGNAGVLPGKGAAETATLPGILKIALQIAEALEAAHEKGVIHRDLKPANIKVTADGKVKVLDFGLAKAYAGEQEQVNLSNSPTLSDAATQQGVILGTAAYMSPEQARGRPVDKRADIWAFGCVLYEMLTGQAAFQGEDVTEILAAVVKGGVNLDLLPSNLHPRVCEVITRCLQKDLNKRYSGINDARYEIDRALADSGGLLVQSETTLKSPNRLRTGIAWAAAALMLGAIVSGLTVWKLKPREPRHVIRLAHELPENQRFGGLFDSALAVSPDGDAIVYATTSGLYLRSLDSFETNLISGTEGYPGRPFFSPDGKWIGYWSEKGDQLKKIAVSGGAPLTITDADSGGVLSWTADGTIMFGQPGKGIMRVSANGGIPKPVIAEEKETLVNPQVLPDGKSLLYVRAEPNPNKVMLYSLQTGERKELFPGDSARYIPTGHIIYALDSSLLAIPFDLKTLSVTGGPVPLVENVVQWGGDLQYAVSDSGTLVYLPASTDASDRRSLVWVDRNGKEESLAAPLVNYFHPRISPDGTRVAVSCFSQQSVDTYIWNIARKTLTRLTFDPAEEDFPLWLPDGKRLAFSSGRGGNWGIFLKSADGTGSDELLYPRKNSWDFPGCWSGDGKTLITDGTDGINLRIGALSMEKERTLKPLLSGKYGYAQPRISPDGRWLAYTSDEPGRDEIYVRPYPELDGGKWQVSTYGGDSALWSPDGRELFYRNGDEAMVVAVRPGQAFNNDSPKTLFRGTHVAASFVPHLLEFSPWDIHPDGKRFLMMKDVGSAGATSGGPRKINIVLNWIEELKQRVPAK
jgi:eukaryotic-like serine/threonine-protein kinase